MLVLSRKAGQEIVVGDNIRITVNKIAGNRVTLGVEAPDHVRILRGELEPIAHAFDAAYDDDEEEEIVPDLFSQTLVVEDDFTHAIPFLPNVAR